MVDVILGCDGNKQTHPALTDKTVAASVIDDYLKTRLGLDDGVATELYWDFSRDIEERIMRGNAKPNTKTRTVSEWLKAGSTIEDSQV